MLVAYVSGHGFGHGTRVGEVLRTLRELEPRLPLTIVTSGPEWLYREVLPEDVGFRSLECDVGLVQRDALEIDEAATLERCEAFQAGFERLVDGEGQWLRRVGGQVVLGDIPPLAFAAATAADVPSFGLANFSWDWIYAHLARREPRFTAVAEAAARVYRGTGLLLELPFAGDLSAFPRRERIPLVARRPRLDREQALARLGEDGRTLVLLSFGGLGLPGLDARVFGDLGDYRFLTNGRFAELPPNVRSITAAELAEVGLGYQDLVAACDVVVTKPGYGIVTDAIGAGTRLVYTERGDFPEYPILVAGMREVLPCHYVSNAELRAGRLGEALAAVLAVPMPSAPDLSGARVAATKLLEAGG
jgi:L-arabinokinase